MAEATQQTLILLKPDCVQRRLVGTIIQRFEQKGLRLAAMKLVKVSRDLAEKHYAVHKGKPFYTGLVSYITSGPVVAMVLEGKKAISVARNVIGATNPADAAPGTIRGDLALEIGRNIVHGSDSPASAEREIKIFFNDDELINNWTPSLHKWIAE